jgi:hypothetical protein
MIDKSKRKTRVYVVSSYGGNKKAFVESSSASALEFCYLFASRERWSQESMAYAPLFGCSFAYFQNGI